MSDEDLPHQIAHLVSVRFRVYDSTPSKGAHRLIDRLEFGLLGELEAVQHLENRYILAQILTVALNHDAIDGPVGDDHPRHLLEGLSADFGIERPCSPIGLPLCRQ